jgi:hypothetical protein
MRIREGFPEKRLATPGDAILLGSICFTNGRATTRRELEVLW